MKDVVLGQLADEWTEQMFTAGGSNEKADRLALVVDRANGSTRYLCGWGREPFRYKLMILLRKVAGRPDPPKRRKAKARKP